MADVSHDVDEVYENDVVDDVAPKLIHALKGVGLADAETLHEAFGLETVRQLGKNKVVRAAGVITSLCPRRVAASRGGQSSPRRAHGGSSPAARVLPRR